MNNYSTKHKLTFFIVLLLASVGIVNAQNSNADKAFIERVYKKIELYQHAFIRHEKSEKRVPVDERDLIRFSIANVKSGQVFDILDTQISALITPPSGEVLKFTIVNDTKTHFNAKNGEKKQRNGFGLGIEWTNGPYSLVSDKKMTLREVMDIEANIFPKAIRYISYEVTVTFKEKTRTYLAVVFIPNSHGHPKNPHFADNITTIVSSLFKVDKSPIGNPTKTSQNQESSSIKKSRVNNPNSASLFMKASFSKTSVNGVDVFKQNACRFSYANGQTLSEYEPGSEGHYTGNHTLSTGMYGSCYTETTCESQCKISTPVKATSEDGTLLESVLLLIYHKIDNVVSPDNTTSSGGPNTYSCSRMEGAVVRRCSRWSGCYGDLNIIGKGSSAKLSGQNLKNFEHKITHNCVVQAEATAGGGGGCNDSAAEFACLSNWKKYWNGSTCSCDFAPYCPNGFDPIDGTCNSESPILIDINGNKFNLTNATNGVLFDMKGAGIKNKFAWTSANSDDAWLVLDRNRNGVIDNGLELFGNNTEQPPSIPKKERNGFHALAVFDDPANGGNGDGNIDNQDAVFADLRLWQDKNHNGLSEPNELKTLNQLGVSMIELDFKTAKKKDKNGNLFGWRAKVWDAKKGKTGRWAWDVILLKGN